MHDYYIRELEEDIKIINNQIKHVGDNATRELRRLEALREEKESRLRQLQETRDMGLNRVESRIDKHYDEKRDDNTLDIVETNREISNLKQARANTRTNAGQRFYNRRIDRENAYLQRLKEKGARLTARQRFFTMPRRAYNSLVDRLRARVLGNRNYLEDRVNDYTLMRDSLGNGVIDRVLGRYFDLRLNIYDRTMRGYNALIDAAAIARIVYQGSRGRDISPEEYDQLSNDLVGAIDAIYRSRNTQQVREEENKTEEKVTEVKEEMTSEKEPEVMSEEEKKALFDKVDKLLEDTPVTEEISTRTADELIEENNKMFNEMKKENETAFEQLGQETEEEFENIRNDLGLNEVPKVDTEEKTDLEKLQEEKANLETKLGEKVVNIEDIRNYKEVNDSINEMLNNTDPTNNSELKVSTR